MSGPNEKENMRAGLKALRCALDTPRPFDLAFAFHCRQKGSAYEREWVTSATRGRGQKSRGRPNHFKAARSQGGCNRPGTMYAAVNHHHGKSTLQPDQFGWRNDKWLWRKAGTSFAQAFGQKGAGPVTRAMENRERGA